jgi:hypothetical protein
MVKNKFAKERRAALKSGDDNTYRSIVSSQIQQEEQIYQEIANECMQHYNIEEQEFIISQQFHMGNPAFQRIMMEMQLGLSDDDKNWKAPISKDRAKEIFKYMEELKFSTMDQLAKHQVDPQNQAEAEDFTIRMLVENAKTGD